MNSKKNLKSLVERRIKNVYKSCLDYIELRFGKEFDGYDHMRAKILRTGNNAIREINETIDRRYEVQDSNKTIIRIKDKDGKYKEKE